MRISDWSSDVCSSDLPSTKVSVYERVAAERGWRITRIFDTHLHADHLSGARLLEQRTGATVHLNPADTFDFPFEALSDRDDFTLHVGTDVGVYVRHTPGQPEASTICQVGDHGQHTGY